MSFIFWANIVALLFSFFVAGVLVGVLFSEIFRARIAAVLHPKFLSLVRSLSNPVIKPGKHYWTTEAVLNPAAVLINGRTHLVYRAIGMDGVSRLGYASSPDGILFDRMLPYPMYVARNPHNLSIERRRYSPIMYPSGGSWGGCEDPRMVVIEGRVYITFNMFENWKLRVGVIAMDVEDFLAERFQSWEGPIILSHSDRDKNWVMFPEKIWGRFAVLHSIIGEDDNHVRVEYVDDLADLAKRKFKSPDPQQIRDRVIAWHVHTRSAGPPPVKTDRGWLVFYHANDAKEGHRYKLGAMLLDQSDPTRILYRAAAPVLVPDEHYENHGKPGIVYACGAVVRDGNLFVYYGGADKVICVATAPLAPFLNALIKGSQTSLTSVPAQTA
jgi:beta-1,2-mannobiose phosphorylase / 1,2-beta-oligomannan phosphorylase